MLWISLVLFVAGSALAQVPFLGVCPNMEIMMNFEVEKYVGKWYEAERYFALFEFGGKCVTANYNLSENGSVQIMNKQISALTGVASSIEGIARLIGRSDDPKLTVTFPSLPLPVDAPYWILDTDYKSYAVVWSCTNFGVFSIRNAWILTREPRPPVAVLEKAYQVIDRNNISRAYFIRTDQKNCPATY
ncbi:apolipoprotein D [Cephus cinctus]|uniref:Apolipoprotein D n=1 Tax=Cephus cinctus TaxID=211228 RepID=A0AAJ7FNW2_CEPCN|nr:apolipoprotein D [Cephus cinctus]XP_015600999.1 apolipoprotein D [Cephus cinctus]